MVKKIDVEKNSSAKNADFQHSKSVISSETKAVIQRKTDWQNSRIISLISWVKRLSLRTKVLVFAFTVSTLPILGIGSLTNYLMNQLVAQEIINKNQNQATHTEIVLAKQRRLLLLLQMGTVVTALLVGGIVAILASRLTQVILAATTAVNELGQGNLNTRIAIEGEDELAVLGSNINHMADQLQDLLQQQQFEAEQLKSLTLERTNLLETTQALKDFAIQLTGILNSEDIYNLAIQDIRKALKVERAFIYKFDDRSGSVIAESVIAGLPCVLGAEISDPCLQNNLERYRQGGVLATNDIYQAGFADFDIEQLEQLAVKAYLIAPILLGGNLLGLLIVHQCSQPRLWQQIEIDLCEQFAKAVGLALERALLLEQSEAGRKVAEIVSQRQSQQTEQMQMQLLRLLEDIAGASTGDLTVRSQVGVGEIATVVDFFNTMLASWQRIVTQIKQAAIQVDSAIAENSQVSHQLAIAAFQQAEQINQTLNFLTPIKASIQTVAKNANQTVTVARTASRTADRAGTTINLAVENGMSLQQTIEETTTKVERLGEYTQEIAHVVASLKAIATQTNLLAINAAIETLRPHADEGDQGFAVVTQEVATLAAQSAAATQEIETVLANIQFEISEVVKAMELSTSQVVEETRLVQDTKQNLVNIFNACCEIDELVRSISAVTVPQVQTSEDMTELIKEMAKVSEMTNHLSGQLSASLQKNVEMSQQLQANVGIFNVG